MTYPCTKCGLCCQHIEHIPELKMFDLGNGTCRYFNPKVGCVIYDDRPLVCKIDEYFKLVKSEFSSKLTFYQANANVCNELQSKHNINVIYRVKL